MTPGDGRPWLAAALLLLQVPGCWSLHGPTSVTGTVGGSVRVQCQYEEEFKEIPKYWCKNPCVRKMVKTKGADREVRKGRVSIRDHPAHLTFTVTLENLKEDDAGTYQCGIDTSLLQGYFRDRTFPVLVSVDPASTATLSFSWLTNFPEFYVTLPTLTWSTTPPQESASSSQHPGSLLGSVHFLLLILLKVPLFLMMLSAVLWVNRPQWAICGHQCQPDEDNLQPSLPIDILPRDTTTQTRRGRTSGPRPVSSPLIAKNW